MPGAQTSLSFAVLLGALLAVASSCGGQASSSSNAAGGSGGRGITALGGSAPGGRGTTGTGASAGGQTSGAGRGDGAADAGGGYGNASGTSGGSAGALSGGSTSTGGSGSAGDPSGDGGESSAGAAGAGTCSGACATPSGSCCGEVVDACGAMLSCGACEAGFSCEGGTCVRANCVPGTCSERGVPYCGTIGDGCGRALDCGGCANGAGCVNGLCVPSGCVPSGCALGSTRSCGIVSDGCGQILNCGDCPEGTVCGREGAPHVCVPPPCTGIACRVLDDHCDFDSPTTLSGIVYDPAGALPLSDVFVYVPNSALEPMSEGANCNACELPKARIAEAFSDARGHFTLRGVPSGSDVPLVVQTGKWRREARIDQLAPCQNNELTDPSLTRLPRNQSEGHLPRIAVSTGADDALECLLLRLGVDPSEFTTAEGDGRIHLYAGGDASGTKSGANAFSAALGGRAFSRASSLWQNPAALATYDVLALSCEGATLPDAKAPYVDDLAAYLDTGGRALFGHLQHDWFRLGPSGWPAFADFSDSAMPLASPAMAKVDSSFPRGLGMAEWLLATGASSTLGELLLYGAGASVTAVHDAQRWLYLSSAVEYFTVNLPALVSPEKQCGRAGLAGFHAAEVVPNPAGGPALGGDLSSPLLPFPDGCQSSSGSAQAMAMAFLFFDVQRCAPPFDVIVEPPTPPVPPAPPPAPPPLCRKAS